jgi:hypothetical protein
LDSGDKDYAAYQSLRGSYRLPPFELRLDRIGKDPYAPSGTGAFGLLVPWRATGLEHDLPSTPARARRGRRSWTAARSP